MSIIGVPLLLFVNKSASNNITVIVTIFIVWVFSVLLVCLVIGPKVYKVEVVSKLRTSGQSRNRVKIKKNSSSHWYGGLSINLHQLHVLSNGLQQFCFNVCKNYFSILFTLRKKSIVWKEVFPNLDVQ